MIFSFTRILPFKSFISSVLIFVVFLVFVFPAKSQSKSRAFYRDTILIHKDYIITVKKTYVEKFLFLKSTIRIYNPTTRYLILDYKSAFATGNNGKARKLRHKEDAVFFPGGNFVQRLKFKPTKRSQSITFHFPKVLVTDSVITNYPATDVPLKHDAVKRVNNVRVQVLKVIHFEKELKVRVRVFYHRPEFLAIDFLNISITGDQSGKIYPKPNPHYRMYHRKITDSEMVTLTFPIQKGEKIEKMMRFENVLKTYTLKELKGFDLNYTMYKDESKVTMSDYDLKKQKKKEEE